MKKIRLKKVCLLFLVIVGLFMETACSSGEQKSRNESFKDVYAQSKETSEPTATPKIPKAGGKEAARKRSKESAKKIKNSSEKMYNQLMDDYANSEGEKKDLTEESLYVFFKFYENIKVWAAPISITSIFLGVLLWFFCKGNKRVQKMGLVGGVIIIPLLMLILVFGMGILIDIFV